MLTPTVTNTPLQLAYFYAHIPKDEALSKELDAQLQSLVRNGDITLWREDSISAGLDSTKIIPSIIEKANIILLLISTDFIIEYEYGDSEDYKNSGTYMQHIMQRQQNNEVRVIPILLRPCSLEGVSFEKLAILPLDKKPIVNQTNREQAWLNVLQEIKKIVTDEQQRLHPHAIEDLSLTELIPQTTDYFIWREDILHTLYTKLALTNSSVNRPIALVGLGGVGKTQLAIEYMNHYKGKYSFVLWAKADTPAILASELFKLAKKLDDKITKQDELNPNVVLPTVRQLLQKNSNWLLVLDNVTLDENEANTSQDATMESILKELPRNGHILMTSRSQSPFMRWLADLIQVETMSKNEAMTLLLLRAGLLLRDDTLDNFAASYPEEYHSTEQLAFMLGYLPLALDQAAAYIEQNECGIDGYIERYQTEGKKLRETPSDLDPKKATVAHTWSLSFQAVEKTSKIAAELLKALSFLAPGAIPEEIILEGSAELGTTLGAISSRWDFDNAVKILKDYSLLQSNRLTRVLVIHRLVQEVLRDDMDDKIDAIWAERVVRAVNYVFPSGSMATWARCQNCQQNKQVCPLKEQCGNKLLARSQRCLPHAQVCITYIKQYKFSFPEAADLLHHTASYLHGYAALYNKASEYYSLALDIHQELNKNIALATAANHHDLARLYRDQYKYEEAKAHFDVAIRIRTQQLGPQDPLTAHSQRSLAGLYLTQAQYRKAESLFKSALDTHKAYKSTLTNGSTFDEKQTADREIANSTYALARLYHAEGRYNEAQSLYKQVRQLDIALFGSDHLFTAQCLNSLGVLYCNLPDFAQAKQYIETAYAIRLHTLEGDQEPRHPDTAQSLNDLGRLYRLLKDYDKAEQYTLQALAIRRAVLNPPNDPDSDSHPDIAQSYNNLASLYSSKARYDEAETYYLKALAINRRILGENHPYTAHTLSSLAELYFEQKKNDDAKRYTIEAFHIRASIGGPTAVDIGQSLYNIARMHEVDQHDELADLFYQYTLTLDEQVLGSADPRTEMVKKRYATFLATRNKQSTLQNT